MLEGMGGPLPTGAASEEEALKRLRGTGWSVWGIDPRGGHVEDFAEMRLRRVDPDSDLDRALGALSHSGHLTDIDRAMIATAVQDRHPGLLSQTRRYVTMARDRIGRALVTAADEANRSEAAGPGLYLTEAMAEAHGGTPESNALLVAAAKAASAGCRIADHQMAVVNAVRIHQMPESMVPCSGDAEVVYKVGLGEQHPDLEAGDHLHKNGRIWRVDAVNTISGLPGIWRLVSVDAG